MTYFHMHLFSIDWPTFNDRKTRLEIYNTRLRRTGLNFICEEYIYMYIIYNRKVLVYRDYEFYEFHVTMNFGREFHRPRLAQHTSNLIASVITCSPHKKPARWRWRW